MVQTDPPADTASLSALPPPMGVPAQAGALLTLAWPVMLSRAGILVMAFTDIAMLGRVDSASVAMLNLALSVFVPVMVFLIGLTTGLIPEIGRAYALGHRRAAGEAWRRGMVWATVTGLAGAVLISCSEPFFLAFGQTPQNAADAARIAQAFAPGVVAQVLFAATAFYLEATHRPRAGLWAMVVANLVNVAANWVLIFGVDGLVPAMGAEGAAWGTTLARFAGFGVLLLIVLGQSDPRGAGVLGSGPWRFWGPGGWRAGAGMRRLGMSAGLSNGFETLGFTAMSLIAGTMGTLPLAAYAISQNLFAMVFMAGLGLSVATGVLVSQAAAVGGTPAVRLAGWTGAVLAALVVGTIALALGLGRETVVAAYTDDPALMARAVALMGVTALVFVPDGLQVVLGQAVRALGDAWAAVAIYAGVFVIAMVPLGLFVAYGLGFDERGLVASIAACCALCAVLLALRFHVVSGRVSP